MGVLRGWESTRNVQCYVIVLAFSAFKTFGQTSKQNFALELKNGGLLFAKVENFYTVLTS